MRRFLSFVLLAGLAMALSPNPTQAGAWLQKKDAGYVKFSYASFRSTTHSIKPETRSISMPVVPLQVSILTSASIPTSNTDSTTNSL
jgi:hypothetical protein